MLSGVDSLEVVTDSEHHGRDGVVVELDTERDDFLTTLTISRLGHADIGVAGGRRVTLAHVRRIATRSLSPGRRKYKAMVA
jgi:hypothetical protein